MNGNRWAPNTLSRPYGTRYFLRGFPSSELLGYSRSSLRDARACYSCGRLHPLPQRFQSVVHQVADVGDREARAVGNLLIAEAVLEFQPDDGVLVARQAVEAFAERAGGFALFGGFVGRPAGVGEVHF